LTNNTFNVGSQADLNNAIETIDSTTTPGTYTIKLTGTITETSAGLFVLAPAPGVVVDVDGGGFTINGEDFGQAFFGGLAVTTGTVSISDLTFKDTLARGGAGQNGGGGGAGLGGGLFVGSTAVVTLNKVDFVDDAARGGAGGHAGTGGGVGGNSSLIYAPLGGGGTGGTPGLPSTNSDTPGGTGGNGSTAGQGVSGGRGGDGGRGFQPGTDAFGESGSDGGDGGKGAMGGVGGRGGSGGDGGIGGSGIGPLAAPYDGGDAGKGGDGGDAGDGGYGAGGGGGGRGGAAGRGALGLTGPNGTMGMASDGGDGGDGGKGGVGGYGGGGGAGGAGAVGGGGGTGQSIDGANGGAGGKGGDAGNGDFGAGGGGGGPAGNGGRAGPTNAGVGSPGSAGAGGSGGKAGLGGFGGGKGADGSNGFAGPSSESSQVPPQAFGGAGGGGLGAGGAIFVADGGQLTVDGGLINGGTVTGGLSGGPGAGAGSFYGSGIFIEGTNTISLATPANTTLTISNVIADEQASGGIGKGTLRIGAGGTVDLDATNNFTGGVTITGGTLELSAPDAAGSGQITFDAPEDPTLEFTAANAPSNPIAGLGPGDFIGVTDKTLSGDIYSGTASGGPLLIEFSDGGSVTLTIVGRYTQSDFPIVNNQIAVTCFRAGTAILTPAGEVAVERLQPGDMVTTRAADGLRPRPVHWIGRRRIDPSRHPSPRDVLPVRVRRGAFAPGVPQRDLLLSPEHCVFIDEVLIPIRLLMNGSTIEQEKSLVPVEYFHVELDRHSILLSEGLATESYLDTGNRHFFDGIGRATVLHPQFAVDPRHSSWANDAFAPLIVDPAIVEPIWRLLRDRGAAPNGNAEEPAATCEPSLHVEINERLSGPTFVQGARYVFVLRGPAARLRLVSNAARPSDTRPWIDDRRRLGVRIRHIVLTQGNERRDISVDHPALTNGWWPIERTRTSMGRWTDGGGALDIVVPAGRWKLEVDLEGEMHYPLAAASKRPTRRSA
jgi:hypothetical protein